MTEPDIYTNPKEHASKKAVLIQLDRYTMGHDDESKYQELLNDVQTIKQEYSKYLRWHKDSNTLNVMFKEFKHKQHLAVSMGLDEYASLEDMYNHYQTIIKTLQRQGFIISRTGNSYKFDFSKVKR